MKVTKKIAEKIVLRDDNTPYGGTSYHGETLANFMAVGGVRFGTSLKKVNEALVECGIMPITKQEVEDANPLSNHYCPNCGARIEKGNYSVVLGCYSGDGTTKLYIDHCNNCGCENKEIIH